MVVLKKTKGWITDAKVELMDNAGSRLFQRHLGQHSGDKQAYRG